MTVSSVRLVMILMPVMATLLLTGCQMGGGNAPVAHIGEGGQYHVVRRGDTLYSIAWRYGMDYQRLAQANNIASPYTIFIGQKVRLGASRTSLTSISRAASSTSKRQPAKHQSQPPKTVSKKSQAVSNSGVNWRWPVQGKVVQAFSLSGKVSKGIDIEAKVGTPVRAAGDGVVVYAGGNLRGYGKLVIVKHSDHFLSAYGNNQSIKVKEGKQVKAGQVLGEVGFTAASVALLHFEIRRDGKPENPVRYLPSK